MIAFGTMLRSANSQLIAARRSRMSLILSYPIPSHVNEASISIEKVRLNRKRLNAPRLNMEQLLSKIKSPVFTGLVVERNRPEFH
ncbi:hypothetical protein [Cohnella abietis]|uniref:hypothetical protein n=1 Tax=Cohnella abietis TaxID=2507935 RepID=UPI00102EBAB5|nr:hypothetical protein [Cohnella abietis]